jgi:hypothetical protein
MRTQLAVPCAETLAPFEPHVPWRKEVLEWRKTCYRGPTVNARRADTELAELLSESPTPFETGLSH